MKHGDVHLYESAAIATYLDEAFDGPRLQPCAAADRARMWQLTTSAIDYFYGPLVRDVLGHAQGAAAPDPAERDRVLDLLEAETANGDYLVGDAVTIADLVIAPMVRFQIDSATDEDLLAKRPKLSDWLNRLSERESFKALEAA